MKYKEQKYVLFSRDSDLTSTNGNVSLLVRNQVVEKS